MNNLRKSLFEKAKELFTIDLRALALFRIALAFLILMQLLDRFVVLKTFYTDEGLVPRELAISLTQPWGWSVYFISGNTTVTFFFFLIAAFFALLLLMGYRTWWATLASYILLVSLETRNFIIPNGGDYLLRLLMFWSLFLPLGARLSIDSMLNSSSQKIPQRIVSMGTVAFLLQVAFVYFFTALSKLGNEVWLTGDAAYDALTLEHYGRPFVRILSHAFPAAFYKFLNYATIGNELICPLLLFFPFFTGMIRLVVIAALTMMQLGFALCLEVNLFPWVTTAALIPFLPAGVCDRLFKKIEGLSNFVIPRLQPLKQRLKPRPLRVRPSLASNLLAGFFLIYVTFSNIEGMTYKSPIYSAVIPHQILPAEFRWIGGILKIEQFWDMFIPPGKIVYWFVAQGKLKEGTTVDILRDGAPVVWEKPKAFFKNEPWRAYLMNLGGVRKNAMSPYVGPYFCREWNKNHIEGQQLQEFEVFVMSQENLPNHQVGPQYYTALLKYDCSLGNQPLTTSEHP